MHRHAETWMRRHVSDTHAFVTDVTSGYCQLNIQGPRSRELLQSLTSADLSSEVFPFRTAPEIDIGYARVLCIRITYVGELGYELMIPAEQRAHVYDRIRKGAPAARGPSRTISGRRIVTRSGHEDPAVERQPL
jgi:glycine cleavage system aminomethyltransferase T